MSDGLTHLLERLPLCANRPGIVEDRAPAGVQYCTDDRPDFVPPPITFTVEDFDAAQVIVVSAPAAVGKSMLGQFIARHTGGVMWDLAHARVGNNFALGTLAASHGPENLGDVVGRLHRGEFLIIADAMDEARLRVNFDSFTAFIDDLARSVAKGVAAGTPAVVLLARTETAEFVADWLSGQDVSVGLAEIQYFDQEGATEFVRKQLIANDHDPDLEAAVEARELLFSRTLRLLGVEDGSWPLDPARRFLGYAPVLVAAARFLTTEGNPRKLVEELNRAGTPATIWAFLVELLVDILEREQDKFIQGFRESSSTTAHLSGFSEWDSLFRPEEQVAWLLMEALGSPEPEIAAPDALQGEYRSAAKAWLPEHPFMGGAIGEFASPVFEDFLYAQALLRFGEDQRGPVRARAADASYRPTEVLARFVFALTDGTQSAEDLPVLYESLLASPDSSRRLVLFLMEDEPPDDGSMRATIFLGEEKLELNLVAVGEPLRFITKLTRATLIVRTSLVQLGVGGRLFEIGPEVIVYAPSVEVPAESILVDGGEGDFGAFVITGSLVASDPTVRFIWGGEHFVVQSRADLRFPFADKAFKTTGRPLPASFSLPEEKAATQALFRVASYFKSEGYSGLGSYADPIDRLAGKSPVVQCVLDVAIEKGVITRDAGIYHFHPSAIGLDFRAVQLHTMPEEAIPFVREIAARVASG